MKFWFAILFVIAGVTAAHAETGVSVAWHGVRPLGLTPEEQRLAQDAIAAALPGDWFARVARADDIAERCGSTVACHCERARASGQRFAAFGMAGRLADDWWAELTLIETHACTVVTGVQLSESLDKFAVARRFGDLGRKLAVPPEGVAATAVKSERTLDSTPAIVSTITAAELAATQMTTLEDAFSSQAGFEVVDTNWGAMPLAQGVRNTILLVVDGIPQINGLLHLRALGRDARISMRNVDRIELVRGPGSVIWGPNAFLGVIHVVTRSPKTRDGEVDAGLELGSSDSQTLWVNGAQARGDYAVAFSIDAGRRRGLPTVVEDSPWAVRGIPAGETAPWGNAGVTEQLADTWLDVGLKLEAGHWLTAMFKNQSSHAPHEIGLFGVKLAPGQEGYYDKTWRTYALSAQQRRGALTLGAHASRFEFYSWENFAIQPKNPDALPTDPLVYREGQRSLQGNPEEARVTHQAELRLAHFAGYPEGGWKNQLLAGIAALDLYTPTNYATLIGVDRYPAEPYLDFGAKHQRSISVFGVDEWSPYPWAVLSGGARLRFEAPIGSTGTWKSGVNLQGAGVLARDGLGAKLVYSEGYRVPDGNSLFSTSGVKGDPTLTAERSRELALQLHADLTPFLTTSVGGNVTRLFNLIYQRRIEGDPIFSSEPINAAQTDIASGFAEVRLTSEFVDAVGRYGYSVLRESNPNGYGIPNAPHNLFGTLVVRPGRDISVFARSTAVSRRIVTQISPAGPVRTRLPWAVRLALGGTISNVLPGFDLDLRIDNPFNFTRRVPYDLSGNATFVEDRTGTEAFVTIRWSR